MRTEIQANSFLNKINRPCDRKRTVIGAVFLLAGLGLLIYSSFFGTNMWDESFYLTIPYRVYLGDALFVDEWHVSLLSSFLQYLPLWAFIKITGSTDGIILFFRILFCISQFFVSCFVFQKLKKYGFTAALISACTYLLHVPLFILSLDYYTMSLMPLVIICMLLFTDEKISTFRLIFSGILLACCVVAEPIMALLFLFYSVAVLIFFILGKKGKTEKNIIQLSFKAWRCILYGIIIVFIPFMIYVLSRESFSELLSNGFNIFLSNEYSAENIFDYITIFSTLNKYFPFVIIVPIWLIAVVIFRKIKYGKIILILLGTVIALIYSTSMIMAVRSENEYAVLYFPFIGLFLTLGFFILTKNKNYNFLVVWLIGFGYILCLGTVSEILYVVGMYGAVISDLIFLPTVFRLLKELSDEDYIKNISFAKLTQKFIVFSVFAISLVQICLFAIGFSEKDLWREATIQSTKTKTVVCDKGPFKGIEIAQCQMDLYNDIMEDIDKIESVTNGQYTVASHNATWLTLCSERRPATFTSWFEQADVTTFEEYYSKNSLIPSAVYIPTEDFNSYSVYGSALNASEEKLQYFLNLFDCTVEEGKAGKILWVNGRKESSDD